MKSSILFLIITLTVSVTLNTVTPVRHYLDPELLDLRNFSESRTPPEADEIVCPAEFNKVDGVFLAWANWDEELTRDIAFRVAEEYKVYLLVANLYFQTVAYNFLADGGVNMDNVQFIIDSNVSGSSMWIRDYGPFYIYEDGTRSIIDFYYGVYYNDDLISYTIGEEFDMEVYDSDLLHHGGNFICDGNGMAFCTSNIFDYNPGYSETQVRQIFRDYLGVDSLVVIDRMINDGTGHIDMFCKLLSDTLFVVGEYETPEAGYPGNFEILNDNADYLAGLTNLQGRQFKVERMLMPPFVEGGPNGLIPYSYTNSLICNSMVLVPIYGFDTDQDILDQYAELMPDHQIYGIDSSFIIEWWGAVHCVANLHFATNPMIILHDQIESASAGSTVNFEFRINPWFQNCIGSVLYRQAGDEEFVEIPCDLAEGIWSCELTTENTDIEYFITASAVTGDSELVVFHPETAPSETFLIEITGMEVDDFLPDYKYNLMNSPNPFSPIAASRNSTTAISYQISDISDVSLNIYNLKGQQVKVLTDAVQSAGSYSVIWDGSDQRGRLLNNGIYYVLLKIDNKVVSSRKCLLIK